MVRRETKAQGLSPLQVKVWLCDCLWRDREYSRERQSQLLGWALSQALSTLQLLSSAALPMLEYASSLIPNAPRTQHKAKAGSSAQLCLCLCLSLRLLSSRAASNVSDKRPSANPPREISALTSPMLCRALFCSADSPSSVAVLPKGSLRSQEVKQHRPVWGASLRPSPPHSFTCDGGQPSQVEETGSAVLLHTAHL